MKKIALIQWGEDNVVDIGPAAKEAGYSLTKTVISDENEISDDLTLADHILILYPPISSPMKIDDSLKRLIKEQDPPVILIQEQFNEDIFTDMEDIMVCGILTVPFTPEQFAATLISSTHGHRRNSQLRKEYAILSSSLESSDIAVRVVDQNKKIVLANSVYARLHEKSSEELLDQPCRHYLSSGHCGTNQCSCALIKQGQKHIEGIAPMFFPGKEDRKYFYTFFPLSWNDDSSDFIIEIFRDITGIIDKERELSHINALYLSIFNNSLVPIVFSSPGGKIIDVNEAFLKLGGYNREELQNLRMEDLYTNPEERKHLVEKIEKEGFLKEVTLSVRKRSGENMIVSSHNNLLNLNGEQVILSIVIDKTHQYTTEEALRESEERLQMAIQATSDALWDWNYQTGEAYFSPQWYTMLGYTPDHFFPSFDTWKSLCHPDDIEGVLTKIQTHIDHDTPGFEAEFRMKGHDEEWHWVLGRGKVFSRDDNNSPLRIVGTHQYIEDRKLFEEKLEKAKKEAERANLSKSIFLSNMSHELRTPLNTIIGFSQILKMDSGSDDTQKQQEFLTYIIDAGNHLLEMVNDVLDLSKIEAGKTEIEKVPFDICKMLERSPSTIQALAKSKIIDMSSEIPSDLGWLNGDEVRIKQVIYNLLSNAIKFTPSGKRIGIKAASGNDTLTIKVWDEGIGIDSENIETIFEAFRQIKSHKIHSGEGTGLGLSISRKLIELHGGTLTAESKPGHGSTFTIFLPERIEEKMVIKQKEEIKTQLLPEYSISESLKILVVDDNLLNAKVIAESLKKENCQIDTAASGEEALSITKDKIFDIILMDIQLPDMDGIDTMKEIKKLIKEPPPIIALTAFAMKGDKSFYLNKGFDDYLSKPVNIEHLISTIILHTQGVNY